ncbi:MAG: spore coat associated protein CotJA [Oscillospiraceae bacterium]|nr:spore coat associated protein CotJA [Oscillospiraceae bacterium]
MAYVPYQLWSDTIYDSQTGMQQGPLFPVLDFPFASAGGDCS